MNHTDTDSADRQRKAVALISGGLDSMLAAKVVLEQGVHVEGINFFTGFCVEGHTHAIRKRGKNKPKRNNALHTAQQLGIKLHIVDVIEEYKNVLINPKHGYGQNMNPCLDCKGFMVRKALEWIKENDFDFIITGEVMGQRPMSQRKDTMPVIQQESGAGDLLVRPLCAQHLPPTLPEREGWLDREKLLGFNGRNRKPQIALAESYGIDDYAQPAGGCCFLTDKTYSTKLVDLWQHRGNKDYELDDIMLLKVGRHIRPNERFKIIIAREDGENKFLEGYKKQFTHMYISDHPGPMAMIEGEASEEDLKLAASIVARYGQGRDADQVAVYVKNLQGEELSFNVVPMSQDDIPANWYI